MPIRCSKYLLWMLILGMSFGFSLLASDPGKQPTMIDRILHPDPHAKSSYQNKTFKSATGYSAKSFSTKDYSGNRQFKSKSFVSKPFEGAKQGWLGEKLFPKKKLPENLQTTDPDSSKKFASKDAPVKNYTDLNKKSTFAGHDNFSTREINLKGKTQGAIDNDRHLQEAIKKGLSIDDVRNLLNKPLQGRAE